MKVSCIQIKSGENSKLNLKKTVNLVLKSIKNGSDLIITPEATSILTDNKKKLFAESTTMDKDPFVKQISLISKNYKKWIIIGSVFIKENKKLRNRSVVFSPTGKIKSFYDKISMFDVQLDNGESYKESMQFNAGKKLKIVSLPWGKLGLTICYDLRFPEIYRALSKKGALFITVPSAFTRYTGKKHWLALLKARAIENFCYIFAPNQTGKNSKKRTTYGHSTIISPDGKILKLIKFKEGIISVDINPQQAIKLRKFIPSLQKKLFI
jgi:predicted amidohydrolase